MTAFAAHSDLASEAAVRELIDALRLTALRNVIEFREKEHKPRSSLRRRIELLRTEQLKREIAS